MLKLFIMGLAVLGACFCLTSYHHGELWHTGFHVANTTIMYAWVILLGVLYGASKLHQGKQEMDEKLKLVSEMANKNIHQLQSELKIAEENLKRHSSQDNLEDYNIAIERLTYYQKAINDVFEWLKMMES